MTLLRGHAVYATANLCADEDCRRPLTVAEVEQSLAYHGKPLCLRHIVRLAAHMAAYRQSERAERTKIDG